VDAIVGRIILDVAVYGAQNHAGTTPMSVRQDALAAAARLVLAIEDIARGRRLCSVSTVGVLEVTPGAVNVVPGLVRMSAEIRDTEPERLARAEAAIHATVDSTRLRTGLRIDVSVAMRERPVRTDPGLRAAITSAAGELGLPHLVMSSGAGHDAQIIATAAPIGMIFVPSAGGVSHAPHEHTDDTQLVAGANVLLQAAMRS
jgi:beta-ureidopropionase / N-carbamoyl-L-amino-acid hydrolase